MNAAMGLKLHPAIIDFFLDLHLNVVSSDFETPFRFTAPYFDDHDMRLASAIRLSAVSGTPHHFNDVDYGRDRILSGFEAAAKDLDHEIGLIAWTAPSEPQAYRSICSSRGEQSSVRLPIEVVAPILEGRIANKVSTKILVVHNHPEHPIRSIGEELLGQPLGPSGTDRRTMWTWAINVAFRSGFTVVPDFYLYESGYWRRIRWPDARTWQRWLIQALVSIKPHMQYRDR